MCGRHSYTPGSLGRVIPHQGLPQPLPQPQPLQELLLQESLHWVRVRPERDASAAGTADSSRRADRPRASSSALLRACIVSACKCERKICRPSTLVTQVPYKRTTKGLHRLISDVRRGGLCSQRTLGSACCSNWYIWRSNRSGSVLTHVTFMMKQLVTNGLQSK